MDEPSPRSIDMPARIAEQLRDQVNRGILSPGLQMRQMELAKQFSVSRVPVREALKLLAAEGLIEHDPNRGFYVAMLSSEEAEQLYRIRHLLEAEVLSTIEWPTVEQLKDLYARVKELDDLLEHGDRLGWVTRHREFHKSIFELSAQKFLVREVLRLLSLTDRYRSLVMTPGFSKEIKANQERSLVEALATRDKERLLQVFEQERNSIEQSLLAALKARGV